MKHKTLTEWFNNLSLKDKLKLYDYYKEQNIELIFNWIPPCECEESRDSQVSGTE
ncbi:unnamed protein product [marine sediment metagenome]|uniref:Uncharacterized protein n=1 Tax=marine sediment metagenome TaxID=412755 RepID=X1CYZ5_9ZZZZ